jgi:hypothetical protein
MKGDDEWLSARKSFDAVANVLGDEHAASAILSRAAEGAIDARADYSGWFDTESNEPEQAGEDTPINKEYWRRSPQPRKGHSFWADGRITFHGVPGEPDRQGETFRLVGVRFRAKQLYSCFEITPPEVDAQPSRPVNKGGATKRTEDWEAFWLEVVDLAHNDQLRKSEFPTLTALREELLKRLTPEGSDKARLSDDSIKPAVRTIYYRFVDPIPALGG